ncbi:multidrug MFS transporter [Thalassococcus sp. S3]|nr:multidrug MFS transporter [Thalassococcus sp. S3]
MHRTEFIALIAMMFATIAFSIDAMLPALPVIGAELSPDDVNRAQLVLTSFVLGMGLGTFFTGPLSDAFGRKPVILAGSALYIAAAATAWLSSTLEVVLLARLVQGIAAAAPRVVATAIVRDLYEGRQMARIMSFAFMIFTIFPAFAPLIGAGIIALIGWRGIFLSFILFVLIFTIWMSVRLPEPLPVENRRPFRVPLLIAALKELLRHPIVRLSIMVQSLCLAMLFTTLTMVQQIYDVIYDRADSFPLWFGAVALVAGSASLLNAWLVVRLGMRWMVTTTLAVQIVLSGAMLAITLGAGGLPFAVFVLWQTSLFFQAGTTLGNLNAIAMEPMGHIAGLAASLMGGVSTVVAAMIAAPIGLVFDGSVLPLALALTVLAALGFLLMRRMAHLERVAEIA